MELLKLDKICFSYGSKEVLKDIDCSFESGKMYAITGKSGAGKITLLSVLSGLAEPASGNIYCNGKNIKEIDKYHYRSSDVGVVFQNFNLLTKLTAVENVELSMEIAGIRDRNKIINSLSGTVSGARLCCLEIVALTTFFNWIKLFTGVKKSC